ncbi:MAG: translation initiation factor [Thermoflavifilum sp.]|nr:translation initiation factor [Thermoflavifilum sp.]
MKKTRHSSGIVYSTDPNFFQNHPNNTEHIYPPRSAQKLHMRLDHHHRKGKVVTLIEGFELAEKELEEIARALKIFCGTGGSQEDGQILLQGDCREKARQWLLKNGFTQIKN